jgi:hypothetical protein
MNDDNNITTKYVKDHIRRVQKRLNDFIFELHKRLYTHDASKLEEPEYSLWRKMDSEPRYPYGTKEYKDKMKRHERVFKLHYKHNRHHPEHFEFEGVSGMDLIDLIEMLIDWISYKDEISVEDAIQLVEIQSNRYNLSYDLKCILKNTLINHYSRMSKISNDKEDMKRHNLHIIDITI